MAGYIKLYREIQTHWLWADKPFSKGQAWIDLLMMANHEEAKIIIGNEIITIERGCLITSEVKLAERWGWSRTKVRDFLNLLKRDQMIDKKSDNKKTYLKIVNYGVWQNSETAKKQQKNSKKTTEKHQKNTNNNDKNVKNDKNEKNIYIGLSENMKNAINDFIEMRKKIRKPMTERALQIMLKKLDGLAKDETTKIAILEQSIEKGWLSVYPLKEDKPSQKQPSQATNFKQRTYSDEFYKKILNASLTKG